MFTMVLCRSVLNLLGCIAASIAVVRAARTKYTIETRIGAQSRLPRHVLEFARHQRESRELHNATQKSRQ